MTSDTFQILWLAVSAVWGTVQLQYTRNSVKVEGGQLGFGQLLSVFLLLGPVVSAVEAIYTTPKTPVTATAPPKDCTSDSDSDITTKFDTSSLDSATLCSPENPTSTPQHQPHPEPPPKLDISTTHIVPLHHAPTSPTSPKPPPGPPRPQPPPPPRPPTPPLPSKPTTAPHTSPRPSPSPPHRSSSPTSNPRSNSPPTSPSPSSSTSPSRPFLASW